MAQSTWPLLIIFLTTLIIMVPKSTSKPIYLYSICSNTSMFTNNSQYHTNLNTLLHSLTTNTTADSGGFYSTTVGNTTNNTVFGIFLCRGDQTTTACSNCVAKATSDLTNLNCPNARVGTTWYDECMVRYSNESFLGKASETPRFRLMNTQNITDKSQFMEAIGKMMNGIAVRASNGGPRRKFATKVAPYSSLQTMYGLGQCTPDLNASECNKCLRSAIGLLPISLGARTVMASCNVRYEVYPFFNGAVNISRPLPPPSPTTDASDRLLNPPGANMGDLMKRQFNILDLSGEKFLEWKVDAQMNLKAQGLEHTIKENKKVSTAVVGQATDNTIITKVVTEQEKAKALVLLRHHLHESLKTEYLLVEDPKELWDSLNDRYGHHKRVLLPKAQFEWTNLRFQDFKSISDYNSNLHRIVSILRYCDQTITEEQMIEKTLTTFHASSILLQEQYRERHFKKCSDLMSVLLVAEQNNDLLLRNHNLRPTGSIASHEVNTTDYPPEANAINRGGQRGYNGRGRGRGNYRGRGRGRGRHNFAPRNDNFKSYDKQKGKQPKVHNQNFSKGKDQCHRCGMTGHWGRACRTAKHLVDLYQASIKTKNIEANFNETNALIPSLDVSDFIMGDF